MGLRVEDIRIVERRIGEYYVFTSPDVSGFHVSHLDREVAVADLQPTLDAMARAVARIEAARRSERAEVATVSA